MRMKPLSGDPNEKCPVPVANFRDHLRKLYEDHDYAGVAVIMVPDGVVTMTQLEAKWNVFTHDDDRGGITFDAHAKFKDSKAGIQAMADTLIATSSLAKIMANQAKKTQGLYNLIVNAIGDRGKGSETAESLKKVIEKASGGPPEEEQSYKERLTDEFKKARILDEKKADPRITNAMKEIEEIIRKYDLAGVFTVTNDCQSGGARILDPSWGAMESSEIPNPGEGPRYALGFKDLAAMPDPEAVDKTTNTIASLRCMITSVEQDLAMLQQLSNTVEEEVEQATTHAEDCPNHPDHPPHQGPTHEC